MNLNKYLLLVLANVFICFKAATQINLNDNSISLKIVQLTNNLRDSLNLQQLKNNSVLSDAATDQSDYVKWKKVLGHDQTTFNKQTPAERVFYYGGNYNYIGENVGFVSYKNAKGEIKTDEEIAKGLFQGWLNSPPHKENLLEENYYQIGIGLSLDTITNRVYGTQVFSALGYRFTTKTTTPGKAYGVQSHDSIICNGAKNFKYGTISLANGLYIKSDSVFIKYHNIEYFNQLIPNANDGYALDIVFRDQLPCNSPNLFHGSEIFDGFMLEPKFRYELLNSNSSENPNKIIAYLGQIPAHLKQNELNLILIRNNHQCDYSYPVHVPADDIPPFYIEPVFLDSSYSFKPIILDTLIQLNFSFERGSTKWNENINYNTIQTLYGYSAFNSRTEINTFSSVEGKEWFNIELQEKRSEKIKLLINQFTNTETILTENILENWPKFHEQVEFFELDDFKNLNKDEVKKKLLNEKNNSFIDSLLFEQRIAKATIKIEGRIDSIILGQNDFLALKYSAPNLKVALASHILYESQGLQLNSVNRELDSTYFNSTVFSSNFFASCVKNKYTYIPDNAVLPNLKNLSVSDSAACYNALNWINLYFHSLYRQSIRYYRNPDEIKLQIEPEAALDVINYLIDEGFQNKTLLSKLKLNYALASIHYFATTNQWSKSTALFQIIFDYFYSADLTIEELTDLTLFCNWYSKFDKTVEMLNKVFEEDKLDENAAFVLAQTATLIYKELEEETYLQYMLKAYEFNSERWCLWLNTNFQVNRNEDVKKVFCSKCL